MDQLHLYRKRYVPDEMIYLKDDQILTQSENMIITKWNTLKPRRDISHGISVYFMDKGYKVSKIYNSVGEIVYWYCDIIITKKVPSENKIIFEDMMIDVIVYENGSVKVVDTVEMADALDSGIVSPAEVSQSLRSLDELLSIIYSNNFSSLQMYINKAEQSYSNK